MTDEQEEASEALYRWTVRGLYALALALNTVLIWHQVKDSPELEPIRRMVDSRAKLIKARFEEREHFRRNVNRVIYEATEVVEEARGRHEG
jgi:hypothetical protein